MVSFLSKIYFFLADGGTISGGDGLTDATTPAEGVSEAASTKVGRILQTFQSMLKEMLIPFIIVVGAASAIYAIWLGVSYSKAEGDARAEAKKRIINFLIGFVCVVVLLILLGLFTVYGEGIVDWVNKALSDGTNMATKE